MGDQVRSVHFPVTLILSAVKTSEDGRSVEAATMGPESIDGIVEGLGTGVSQHDIIVQIPGTAYQMPLLDFKGIWESSPGVRHMVNLYQQALFFHSTQSALCLALHRVEERLARWLLMARYQTGSERLSLTHEFLAQMLGVERSTVSTTAHLLQNAGLIRYARGNITILNEARLEATSCECYRSVRRAYEQALPLKSLASLTSSD